MLGIQRTLLEAVSDLRDAGELDAAVEAANTAEPTDHDVHRALETVREIKTWRDNRTADIETLYARLDMLVPGADEEQGSRLALVKSALLTSLEEVDFHHRDVAESVLDSCRNRVAQLELDMSAGVAHRAALNQWLSAAGITPPYGASLERLESLIRDARETAAPRRAHLLRPSGLWTPHRHLSR